MQSAVAIPTASSQSLANSEKVALGPKQQRHKKMRAEASPSEKKAHQHLFRETVPFPHL